MVPEFQARALALTCLIILFQVKLMVSLTSHLTKHSCTVMCYSSAAVLSPATETSHATSKHTDGELTKKDACSDYCTAILSQNLPPYNSHILLVLVSLYSY